MFGFKKKNYLKRTDFISSVDSNKIWSKSMSVSEIEDLLEKLEIKISEYEFDTDKNFIMNSRRKALKETIEEQLQKTDGNINELVQESLFNFGEFVGDEYSGTIIPDGISVEEFVTMDKEYREKGIICLQEKEAILEMIKSIKNYINKGIN